MQDVCGMRNGEPWTDEEDRELQNLRKRGFSYHDIARHMGRSRNSVSYRLQQLNDCPSHGYPQSGQKCWNCAKFCVGCAWSERRMPVKGWKAEPTIIRHGNRGTAESWNIIECPEFVEG